MLEIISKLHITVFIFILLGIILNVALFNTSCSSVFIAGGEAIGKVSNTFGTPLNRDIDNDGDSDACVVVNNIADGNSDDVGRSVYVDSSGKVYVTGYSKNVDDNGDMYVIKLNNDGNLDTSFGNKGKVVVNNIAGGNGWDRGNSLYVDKNGKVYVTGYSKNTKGNFDMYVIRLRNDGIIDNTFGSPLGRDINEDGINDNAVIISNIAGGNGYDYGYSLYVDSSGKVYVTGSSYNGNSYNGSSSDMYVIRLNSDGTLDTSFGNSGKVVVNNIAGKNSYDVGLSLCVDNSGKVYITGFSNNGSNDNMYVIRLNSNGSFDTSFGNKGKIIINGIAGRNSWDRADYLYVDKNGKVYVTGTSKNVYRNSNMYVIKLNNNGSLDKSFGNNGKVIVNKIASGNIFDYGKSLYVDNNGKIYITGASYNGSNFDMYVIRLNSDGSLDTSFGTKGKVVVNNIAGGNSHDVGYSLYVDKNGKVYVTGDSWNGSNRDMYVIQIE